MQHAEDVPDRVDAALALGDMKGNDAAIAALGEAAAHDRFWGVRVQALTALGRIGGAQAEKAVLPGLADTEPWVREVAVEQLSKFSDDPALAAKLTEIANKDTAYRVRAAALLGLGQRKAEGAMTTLESAAKIDSPDDVIRRAALRAMGALGNDQAAPRLIEWIEQGKPMRLRTAAIDSLGKIAKKDEAMESRLIALLNDSGFRSSPRGRLCVGRTRRFGSHRTSRDVAQERRHPFRRRPGDRTTDRTDQESGRGSRT